MRRLLPRGGGGGVVGRGQALDLAVQQHVLARELLLGPLQGAHETAVRVPAGGVPGGRGYGDVGAGQVTVSPAGTPLVLELPGGGGGGAGTGPADAQIGGLFHARRGGSLGGLRRPEGEEQALLPGFGGGGEGGGGQGGVHGGRRRQLFRFLNVGRRPMELTSLHGGGKWRRGRKDQGQGASHMLLHRCGYPVVVVIIIIIISVPGPRQRGRLGGERHGPPAPRRPQVTPEDAAVAARRRGDVPRLLGDGGPAVLGLSQGSLLLKLGPQSLELDRPVLEHTHDNVMNVLSISDRQCGHHISMLSMVGGFVSVHYGLNHEDIY